MHSWRLLDVEFPDAASNLALEEALARQIGEGRSPLTLRLWRNRRAAVIGENQSARSELQLDACQELGVEVIRRFTGGGAVYHDLGNLNYSICTPRSPASDLALQRGVFRKSLNCAATYLSVLGLNPALAPVNTITVRGLKIFGGAGAIRWGAVFYHGSILVSTDLEMVWRILRREQPQKATGLVQSIRLPVTSLQQELGREIPMGQVKEALTGIFRRTFDASVAPEPATEQELDITSRLAKEKYGNRDWNLKM